MKLYFKYQFIVNENSYVRQINVVYFLNRRCFIIRTEDLIYYFRLM